MSENSILDFMRYKNEALQNQILSPIEMENMAISRENRSVSREELSVKRQERLDETEDARKFSGLLNDLQNKDPSMIDYPEFKTRNYNALAAQLAINRNKAKKTKIETIQDPQTGENVDQLVDMNSGEVIRFLGRSKKPPEKPLTPSAQITQLELDQLGKMGPEKQKAFWDRKMLGVTPTKLNATQNDIKNTIAEEQKISPDDVTWPQIHEREMLDFEKKAKITGEARGEAYGVSRKVNVYDTKTSGMKTMNMNDFNKLNKAEPDRYLDEATAAPILEKTANFNEMLGSSGNVRKALDKMPEFTTMQRIQLSMILRSRDSSSAVSSFLAGSIGQTLSPEQQDYVINLQNLIESAVRIARTGQGSDTLRGVIWDMIPSAATWSKEAAYKYLDAFDAEVARLKKGLPKIKLPEEVEGLIGNEPNIPTVSTTRTPEQEQRYQELLKKAGGK
jgi:hypothetical protein